MGINAMRHAVFLDRDGVLNDVLIRNGKPYAPLCLEELSINKEAYSALSQLKEEGFLLIVVTNQPDVSRGVALLDNVESIHQKLCAELPLDDIKVCYHDDKDQCCCRKPKPGLIQQAAKEHSIMLKNSFMIGDRWKDILSANAAPCKSIWLKSNYLERHPETMDYTANNLSEAAEWIIFHYRSEVS